MKKKWMIVLSCVLAVSLTSGTAAFAKSNNDNGNKGGKSAATAARSQEKKNAPAPSNSPGNSGHAKESVSSDVYGSSGGDGGESVTSTTYGGPNGYKGLLNAIENVKDKPAGAVLANLLLTKYEVHLTDEMKTELEGIQAPDAALSATADLLDEQGSVLDAVYVEKEAIKANAKNLITYQKLGKLNKKLGRTGINLFVNGDEVTPAVSPIIRSGTTLVPFRAISEALQAEVSWNPDEGTVTVTRGGTTVKLVIDSKKAYVNGKAVQLDVPATVKNGSTVVPVRFVSEALQATVKWEPVSQSVVVYEE